PPPHSPSPDPSALICGGKDAATPGPGVRPRLTPEKPQQRIAVFTQPTEPLSPSTGIFTWNHSHITSQGLAVCKALGITQEYLGRQRRDWPHSRRGHQQPYSGTFASLLLDSLV